MALMVWTMKDSGELGDLLLAVRLRTKRNLAPSCWSSIKADMLVRRYHSFRHLRALQDRHLPINTAL